MSKLKLPKDVRPVKEQPPKVEEKPIDQTKLPEQVKEDPNELHERLLKENNLKLDFDVLEGTISTKYGIIKLPERTLVIKASYVSSK